MARFQSPSGKAERVRESRNRVVLRCGSHRAYQSVPHSLLSNSQRKRVTLTKKVSPLFFSVLYKNSVVKKNLLDFRWGSEQGSQPLNVNSTAFLLSLCWAREMISASRVFLQWNICIYNRGGKEGRIQWALGSWKRASSVCLQGGEWLGA